MLNLRRLKLWNPESTNWTDIKQLIMLDEESSRAVDILDEIKGFPQPPSKSRPDEVKSAAFHFVRHG